MISLLDNIREQLPRVVNLMENSFNDHKFEIIAEEQIADEVAPVSAPFLLLCLPLPRLLLCFSGCCFQPCCFFLFVAGFISLFISNLQQRRKCTQFQSMVPIGSTSLKNRVAESIVPVSSPLLLLSLRLSSPQAVLQPLLLSVFSGSISFFLCNLQQPRKCRPLGSLVTILRALLKN